MTSWVKVPTTEADDVPTTTAGGTAAQTPACTDQLDYSSDPRSNAEISSQGAQAGVCPVPITVPPGETPRCTDQIDYAGAPRSNAEINSIGAQTGVCPAPIPGQ
ncbi:hypothetical protein ACWDPV_19950 [Gordonia sp. NPDC003504]